MSEYRNRRGWLIFFGVQLVGLGLLCLAMAALVGIGTAFAGREQQAALPLRMMISAAAFYVVIAALFLTLGAGSIGAKRWAQALTLVISWMWLITGVLGTAGFIFMAPRMFRTMPEQQAATFAIGCSMAILVLFFILLPLAFVLFYRAPSVRATVMTLDPTPRWTDALPIPLLAFAIWMLLGGVSVLAMGLMYKALPFGGFILRGIAVPLTTTALGAVLLLIGWGSLKRRMAAWWAALGLAAVGAVYSTTFLKNTDFSAWYEAMEMPSDPHQVEMMEAMYSGPFYFVWMGVLLIGYFAFLFYVRRYFQDQNVERMMPPST